VKDNVAASPGGTLIWRRVWQHWTNFTDLTDFTTSANALPRSKYYPGRQDIIIVDIQQCKQQMPWPGACTEEGLNQNNFATDTNLTTFSTPLGQDAEGGYAWACFNCYLSGDAPLDPACISAKGVATCFNDLALAQIAAKSKPPQAAFEAVNATGATIGGVIAGGRRW
jgi:hypothetical protein